LLRFPINIPPSPNLFNLKGHNIQAVIKNRSK
jgi:hypothetical protein